MDKYDLLIQFRELMQKKCETLCGVMGQAKDGARLDMQDRPSNRGERGALSTQGYLAGGLSSRLEALHESIRLLDDVDISPKSVAGPGALVLIGDNGQEKYLIFLPGGSGEKLMDEQEVIVLSPLAPLAQALGGREEGDELVFNKKNLEVLGIW